MNFSKDLSNWIDLLSMGAYLSVSDLVNELEKHPNGNVQAFTVSPMCSDYSDGQLKLVPSAEGQKFQVLDVEYLYVPHGIAVSHALDILKPYHAISPGAKVYFCGKDGVRAGPVRGLVSELKFDYDYKCVSTSVDQTEKIVVFIKKANELKILSDTAFLEELGKSVDLKSTIGLTFTSAGGTWFWASPTKVPGLSIPPDSVDIMFEKRVHDNVTLYRCKILKEPLYERFGSDQAGFAKKLTSIPSRIDENGLHVTSREGPYGYIQRRSPSGQLHGIQVTHGYNSTVESTQPFEDGVRHGISRFYDYTGKLYLEQDYRKGKMISETRYKSDGTFDFTKSYATPDSADNESSSDESDSDSSSDSDSDSDSDSESDSDEEIERKPLLIPTKIPSRFTTTVGRRRLVLEKTAGLTILIGASDPTESVDDYIGTEPGLKPLPVPTPKDLEYAKTCGYSVLENY